MSEDRRRPSTGGDLFAELSQGDLAAELASWDSEFDSLVEAATGDAANDDAANDDASTLKVDVEQLTLAQVERLGVGEGDSLFGEANTNTATDVEAEAIDEDDIVDEIQDDDATQHELAASDSTALDHLAVPDDMIAQEEGVAEAELATPDQAATQNDLVAQPAPPAPSALADVDVASAFAELGPPQALAASDDDDDFYAELEIETEAFALSGEWSTQVPTKDGQRPSLADVLRAEPRQTVPAAIAAEASGPAISRQRTTQQPPLNPANAELPYIGNAPIVAPSRRRVRDASPKLSLDDLGAIPGYVAQRACDLEEDAARLLLTYEQELAISADPARVLLLRNEAGRLALLVGDAERAKLHFESTLLRDPNSLIALRGLRAVARVIGDWREAASYCEAELELVSAQERMGVALLRIYYLLVAREQDLARVAVGEFVEEHPHEVAARLIEAELGFVDHRPEEVFAVFSHVAQTAADPALAAWARRIVACAELDASPAQALASLEVDWNTQRTTMAVGADMLRVEASALMGDHAATVAQLVRFGETVTEADAALAASISAHAAEIALRHVSDQARVALERQAFELAPSSSFVADRVVLLQDKGDASALVAQAVAALVAADDLRSRAYVAHLVAQLSPTDAKVSDDGALVEAVAQGAQGREQTLTPDQLGAVAFWRQPPRVVGQGDSAYHTLSELRLSRRGPSLGEPRLHAAWLAGLGLHGVAEAVAAQRQLWESPLPGDATSTISWLLRARSLVWLERDGHLATAERQQLATHAPRLARLVEPPGRPAAASRSPRASSNALEASAQDGFVAALRGAEDALLRDETSLAFGLLARALGLRPAHPFALSSLAHAAGLPDTGQQALPVIAELRRHADASQGKEAAVAYEALAALLLELGHDANSVVAAREAAINTKHASAVSWRGVEAHHISGQRATELWLLRQAMLKDLFIGEDAVAVLLDTAALGERDNKPDGELLPMYRQLADSVDVSQPGSARVLLLLESMLRRNGSTRELADISVLISQVFAPEPMLSAAFLTRSAETLLDLGHYELATAHFRNALATVPLYRAAATGWLRAAILQQRWDDACEAARCEAVAVRDALVAAQAWHLAAVIEMDRKTPPDLHGAYKLLRAAYAHDPQNRDVVVRILSILAALGDDDRRAAFWQEHLVHEQNPAVRAAMHRELARYLDGQPHEESRQQATTQWEALRALSPHDIEALRRLTDIYWASNNFAACAKILAARVRMEEEPSTRAQLFRQLGELYTTATPDAALALRAWREVLVFHPQDAGVLEQIALAAAATGDAKLGVAACERWLRADTTPSSQARCLRYMGQLLAAMGEGKRAERALVAALDRDPTDELALAALVAHYKETGDAVSAKVRLDRIANVLRAVCIEHPSTQAFLALARVHEARDVMGGEGVWLEAAFARQMAGYLQGGDALAIADTTVGLVPELVHLLFPQGMSGELRHIFMATGDRLAKHIGSDLRAFGVSRADRLRADSEAAQRMQSAAARGGFNDVDIYVTDLLPMACVPVLTTPLVLVVGRQLLEQPSQLRAAVAAALFLAQTKLALAMTLASEPFSQLLGSLLHLFQGVVAGGQDQRALEREAQKLRRLLPSALLAELRPFGLAIDPSVCSGTAFRDHVLVAAYRAGLLASGDMAAVVDVILGGRPESPLEALAHPTVRDVIRFALSDDAAMFGAAIGRATKSTIPPPGMMQ